MAEQVITPRREVGGAAPPAPGAEPLPPPRAGVSMRPAFLVVGLALAIVVGFSVFAVLTTGDQRAGIPTAPSSRAVVPGTGLRATSAAAGLRPIESPGQPPANIVGSVVLPAGAVRYAVADNSSNADQYDQQVTFTLRGATQGALFAFFHHEMQRYGWSIFSTGPAAHEGEEVLAQKAGDDGWYWEMGAVVEPTTFASSAAGRGTGAETTRFTIRLFQVPDPS